MYHNDHPVCAASEASRLFLTGAATPPVPGGEHHVLAIHSHLLAPGATLCRRSAVVLKTRTLLLPEALWSVLHRSVCRMKPAVHRAC